MIVKNTEQKQTLSHANIFLLMYFSSRIHLINILGNKVDITEFFSVFFWNFVYIIKSYLETCNIISIRVLDAIFLTFLNYSQNYSTKKGMLFNSHMCVKMNKTDFSLRVSREKSYKKQKISRSYLIQLNFFQIIFFRKTANFYLVTPLVIIKRKFSDP